MEKLPEDFKQKWIAALRSGEYKQGQYSLLDEQDRMCCLGLAGILCGADKNYIRGKAYFDSDQNHAETRVLPPDGYPEILDPSKFPTYSTLAQMNDHGKSFSEIADYIEANL